MLAIAAAGIANFGPAFGAETWRGLVIAPEDRCTPYDREEYRYSQSVEAKIVATMGGRIYGPYTGRHFSSTSRTDIEHIVAVSEGHDSGLCAADPSVRHRFASDLLNLTLAAPEINRCGGTGKCAYDAAEWLPPQEPLLVRHARPCRQVQVFPDRRPRRGHRIAARPLGLLLHRYRLYRP